MEKPWIEGRFEESLVVTSLEQATTSLASGDLDLPHQIQALQLSVPELSSAGSLSGPRFPDTPATKGNFDTSMPTVRDRRSGHAVPRNTVASVFDTPTGDDSGYGQMLTVNWPFTLLSPL